MVNDFEERMRRAMLIAQVAIMLALGFSVTVVLRSARFRQEAALIARGVGQITAGVGLKVGALEARIANRVVKTAGFGIVKSRNVAMQVMDAVVRDVSGPAKPEKLPRILRFLNAGVVVAEIAFAVEREDVRTEGDVPQIVAAAAVELTAGVLTLGLAPRGVSGLVRDPETDTLVFVGKSTVPAGIPVIPGAISPGFLAKANVIDLVAEAIRLLVTG